MFAEGISTRLGPTLTTHTHTHTGFTLENQTDDNSFDHVDSVCFQQTGSVCVCECVCVCVWGGGVVRDRQPGPQPSPYYRLAAGCLYLLPCATLWQAGCSGSASQPRIFWKELHRSRVALNF